ncbi:MAG: lysophospholipid acyltransferase family protein [Acidobacteriota bacterium]
MSEDQENKSSLPPQESETEKPQDQQQSLVKAEKQSPEPVGASLKTKVGIGFGLALGAAVLGSLVIFRLMNRIKVDGLENIPTGHENVLYCLNHNSVLDNFAFETAVYMPKIFFHPDYIPVNLADRKNFFGDPSSPKLKDRVLRVLGKYFFTHLRAYPVDRKTGDLGQVDKWIELLKNNIVVVFPEGTRSRTGEIGQGKPGVGKMIYNARPIVIPVRMIGMDEVLGVGRIIPRAFHTIHIIIGKPLDLSNLLDQPLAENETEQISHFREIANQVVEAIRALTPGKK